MERAAMMDQKPDPLRTYAFAGHSGGRAVVVIRGLHCPRCSAELTADDCHADTFGTVALQCGLRRAIVLAVGQAGKG